MVIGFVEMNEECPLMRLFQIGDGNRCKMLLVNTK